MPKTGTIVATTLGAAAAAAGVTLAALRKRDASGTEADDGATVVRVVPGPSGEGWQVEDGPGEQVHSRFDTKRDAVQSARERVRASLPSRLVIHRADGTIERHHSYPATS